MKKFLIAALLPVSALAATPTGTQSFADLGIPLADGSPNGNILTADSFTIGDLVTTAAHSGVFMGLPVQSFGSITFDRLVPNSLVFTDGPFGTFRSTLIDPIEAGSSITFFVVGNWTPGSFEKGFTGAFPSDLTISFTQTPRTDGTLSDSATFSTPAQVSVPAPTDWLGVNALLAMGVGGVWWFTRRRHV